MVHNGAWRRSLLCVLALSLGFASPPCEARIYTNHWAVRIAGGPDVADRIAAKYGYRNMGQVGRAKLVLTVGAGPPVALSAPQTIREVAEARGGTTGASSLAGASTLQLFAAKQT